MQSEYDQLVKEDIVTNKRDRNVTAATERNAATMKIRFIENYKIVLHVKARKISSDPKFIYLLIAKTAS